MSKVSRFVRDEEGLELSEYAVAGSLIVLGVVAAFALLSGNIDKAIRAIAGYITTGA